MNSELRILIEALNNRGIHVVADKSFDNIHFDFSEHDKKVSKEKDNRINELERDLKEYKDEVIAVRKNRDEMMDGFRKGIEPYVDLCQMHEIIAELEAEISNKNKEIIEKNQRMIELIEQIEKYEKIFNSSLPETDCSFERIFELEDRHQSDCIRINQLLTTIDVLTERYQKLREVHGL